MKNSITSLLPYRRCVPQIVAYQLISKGILALILFLYRQLTGFVLWNAGRPAYTSGDLPYLMTSWEGWVLLLLGFLLLVIYTVFDINAAVLLSDRLLKGEKIHVLPLLKEAAGSLLQFRNIRGVLAILYVSLAAPLTGAAFGITLTSNFVVPNFITSVIRRTAILHLLYIAGLAVLAFFGLVYVFTFDFAILGRQSVPQAMKSSKTLMRKNWKNFLLNWVLFLVRWAVLGIVLAAVLYALPCFAMRRLPISREVHRAGIICFSILTAAGLSLYAMLISYYTQMKLTVLYRFYTETSAADASLPETVSGVPQGIFPRPEWRYKKTTAFAAAALVILAVAAGIVTAPFFDSFYPAESHAQVIAHRAGGNLANENTVPALEAAIGCGAYGAEIDVQRTKDGAYIVSHDNTFRRTCGDSRTPGDMTLAEVKQLKVKDTANLFGASAEVATLEEMLDAANGKIRLYIELKGKSADRKMAEDVIKEAVRRGMEEQVVLISLDYELIDYIETEHPEIRTGYLCYFAFGQIEKMNCDELLMEEEVATDANVERIHDAGKTAGVWTVNTSGSMAQFLGGDVDYIITDEVPLAGSVRRLLENRNDEARVFEAYMRMA